MAFKKVVDLSTDTTISLGGTNKKTGKKNPSSIEGYYLGKREVADKKKKSGISYIYTFQTDKGNIGVWGKTDLDRKMSGVTPGVMTRASFDKMVPTPNGDMYKFNVEIDDSNTVEVVGTSPADSGIGYAKEAALDTDDEPASFDSTEEDDTEDDEELLAAAQAAAAARKAKVAKLLGKSK